MEVLDTPKTITTNITIASFKIQCAVVVLNTTANINVTLFNSSGDNVGYKSFIMTNDEYLLWGEDDTYIVSFVKTQIDLMDTI